MKPERRVSTIVNTIFGIDIAEDHIGILGNGSAGGYGDKQTKASYGSSHHAIEQIMEQLHGFGRSVYSGYSGKSKVNITAGEDSVAFSWIVKIRTIASWRYDLSGMIMDVSLSRFPRIRYRNVISHDGEFQKGRGNCLSEGAYSSNRIPEPFFC